MKILLLIVMLNLAGCVAHRHQAVMFNPETKQTAQCKSDPDIDLFDPSSAVRHCVKGYEKAGFIRVDDHPETED